MNYTNLMKTIWTALYDSQTSVPEIVEKYFHPEYEQCINGVRMNRQEYIHHVQEQKKNMTVTAMDYKHVLENGNELFALYYPRGKNKDLLPVEAEVLAYFQFEDQQILRIHGQVRLLQGAQADVDMK